MSAYCAVGTAGLHTVNAPYCSSCQYYPYQEREETWEHSNKAPFFRISESNGRKGVSTFVPHRFKL